MKKIEPTAVIENLVTKLQGEPEPVFDINERVRFNFSHEVNGTYSLTIGYDKESGGIAIYKSHGFDDTLEIYPRATNRIIVK